MKTFCGQCGHLINHAQGAYCTECGTKLLERKNIKHSDVKKKSSIYLQEKWTLLRFLKYLFIGLILLGLMFLSIVIGSI